MRDRFGGSTITVAIVAAAVGAGVIAVSITRTSAQSPAASATAPPAPTPASAPVLKTPWGEPDLQGIWTDEFDTPLQRPAKYADQEFFAEAQREELDRERSVLLGRRATDLNLVGAYNIAVFMSTKHTGARTSLALGRGPDPATKDNASLLVDISNAVVRDP
jgi:hypothetical protein